MTCGWFRRWQRGSNEARVFSYDAVVAGGGACICAHSSSFTEDADWENAFGSREKGRNAIERRLTGVYTMYQEAGREDQEPRIAFITDDVAVADRVSVYHGQVGTRDQPLPPRRVRNTYVLHKVGGAWHVALYRGADLRGSADVPR